MMCNIWKIPSEVPNLPVDKWINLLDSDLFSNLVELDVTGGEPFLKKGLPDFFRMIGELRQARLNALKSVSVTTNGLLTDRVLSVTEQVLPALRNNKLDLVMVCALDAIGDIHDKIRNIKNAWKKVNRTIEGLVRLKEKYPNFIVGLKTTVLPLNIDALNAITEYANDRGLFTIVSPCIITSGRYLNLDKADAFPFSREDITKMTEFYTNEKFSWSFHAQALIHYFETGVMKKPCTCGFNYLFLRSSGEMFLCPLVGDSIGDITRSSAKELFLSPKANRMRRKIGKMAQCTTCTEPGLERYSLPLEGFSYLRVLAKLGEKRFWEMHNSTGLDKYFAKY
jgi:MoaA/NifB/PqqE/SkfB family radical SAM enzyme